jgi:hypothetical protein
MSSLRDATVVLWNRVECVRGEMERVLMNNPDAPPGAKQVFKRIYDDCRHTLEDLGDSLAGLLQETEGGDEHGKEDGVPSAGDVQEVGGEDAQDAPAVA